MRHDHRERHLPALLSLGCLALFCGGLQAAGRPPLADLLPEVALPGITRGETAIQALGEHLPAVAAAYRQTSDELRALLRRDRTLALDPKGRLFYTDTALPEAGAGQATAMAAAAAAPYPLDDTFRLHSRPGARRLIYLDFDGHLLSGTAWNASRSNGADIVCPQWDIDGNPAAFGDGERTAIQQIWQRVAEDFLPFDVDVTTEYPGEAAITRSSTADEAYGMRVLVSPISSYFGNYGGFAYIGAFDDVGDYYKPALVFPEKLAHGEKYIGEACAHETGHTVGLSHDGTTNGVEYYQGHGSGDTGWAPIMGNSYYKNLTQWSKGEYAAANNRQDDLTIIASYLSVRPDDHGNTAASATVLPTGPQLSAGGFVERNTDLDVIGFVAEAGPVSINVTGGERGGDLDIAAELRDPDGNLLAASNPLESLTASLSATVPAGTYFLHVRGTGKGDPLTGYSAYGSLGQYSISATVVDPSGHVAPVAVAAATPPSGEAPLTVRFEATQSFDLDGVIVAWAWDFGDGTGSFEANPTHLYPGVGAYTATLTVTDNSGLADSTAVTVTVLPPNAPPVAVATATPGSGYAPLTVTLSGAGSSDPDGGIVSWQWDFGDGATGSGPVVQHTYQSPGTYPARLTVMDDRGASSSSTVLVAVQQDPDKVIRVGGIALSVSSAPSGQTVQARVKIISLSGMPIAGATVTASWSGPVTGNSTATTDASGAAVLTSKRFKKSGTVKLTVTNVSKSGCVYDPAQNLVTSATIAAAPTL